MTVLTRNQHHNICIHDAATKTRAAIQFTRFSSKLDQVLYNRMACIKNMMEENDKAKSSERYAIIFKMFDYFLDIREDLWQFGPEFCKALLCKLNDFINLSETHKDFSNRMYEYKTILLPYIR
jgi:hypothetical protein